MPSRATTMTTVTSVTTQVVPGAHQDPADFFGILVALVVIVGAIVLVRLAFRSRRRPRS
ncbi:MAG: hypothetical protein ACRDXE_03515 [Acidimicrobiales bacterium]